MLKKFVLYLILMVLFLGCFIDMKSDDNSDKKPLIVITQNDNQILSGSVYNFEDVAMNQSSSVIFKIENRGTETLELTDNPAIYIEGDHQDSYIITQPEDFIIAPASSSTFSINFSPLDSLGLNEATIRILNNDTERMNYSFEIQGVAIEDSSPINFDWYLNFNWFTANWGEDPTSTYIKNKTGVDINFITPTGSESEYLNNLVSSNELPDFITLGWWEHNVDIMINDDMVYALDELADLYYPTFFDVASAERMGWYREINGHTYGYPNASFSPTDYDRYDLPSNTAFLVRKDMYEAIGSPSMRTPEEFITALTSAKELFPEVNGEALIPFGTTEFTEYQNIGLGQFLPDFLAIPRQINGQLVDRTVNPEYKRWLEVLRTANEQGLISSEIFTDNTEQIQSKIESGRYFAIFFPQEDLRNQQQGIYMNDPDSIYIAIDGPANVNLDNPTLPGLGIAGWTLTLISKNCTNPARAIQFLSYWLSEEGQHDFSLGAPGQWETINGYDRLTTEATTLLMEDRVAYDLEYGGQQKFWMLMDSPMIKGMKWEPPLTTPNKELEEWSYPYTQSYAQFDIVIPGDSPYTSTAYSVDTLSGTYVPLLIQAESQAAFDVLWNQWQIEKSEAGIDSLYGYMQSIYEENCEKIGVPTN